RIASELGVRARASLRVNPDVDAKTHKYTTTGKKENKFGIDILRAKEIFERFKDHPNLHLRGVHLHLGSPIASPDPYAQGVRAALALIDELASAGITVEELNLGGGFGIDYGRGAPSTLDEFGAALVPMLEDRVLRGLRVLLEPGRPIVGNAGVLLTRVQYVKQGRSKRFVVVDSGMHQLVRPALYEAYHFAWPAKVAESHEPRDLSEQQPMEGLVACDLVGPICESSDFLALDRSLPPVSQGDLMAVFSAGAYGMSMASTYNDHPKPAEVLVDGESLLLIRPRQSILELVAPELGPPIELTRGPATPDAR
ncbi:MAG: diaminopimelate decarboxylase, partial [Phycisphaerales bacterium]